MSSLITDGPVTSWLTGMSMIDSTEYVFTCMLYALCLFLCASHFTKSVSWSISLSVCRFGLNHMPQSAGRTLRSLPMQWKLMEQLSFGGDLQKNSIFGNNSRCCLYKLIPNSWMCRYKNFVGDGCVAYVCVCFSDTTLWHTRTQLCAGILRLPSPLPLPMGTPKAFLQVSSHNLYGDSHPVVIIFIYPYCVLEK